MPNWCSTFMQVKGERKYLDLIKEALESDLPITNTMKLSGVRFEGREAVEVIVDDYEDYLNVELQTAWREPSTLFEVLHVMGGLNYIQAVYYEAGTNYGGVYQNGHDIEIDTSNMEEMETEAGVLLNENFNILDDQG